MLHNQHKHLLVANRVAFMAIGVLEAAWAPLVPYVKSSFAIDEGTLGLLMLCSGFGSICALPLSGFLVNRFGAKKVVYVSGLLMAFALLTISLLMNMWLTGAMLMVFGGCTITIDVAANMNGVAIERKTGRYLMSGFHGGYSLGTLIGAGAMSVLFTLASCLNGLSSFVWCPHCLRWCSDAGICCRERNLCPTRLSRSQGEADCTFLPWWSWWDCCASSCMPRKVP